MKAKIKRTGEIVNLAEYCRITLDSHNSYGDPIELSPEEVELIQETADNINWQALRHQYAGMAMLGILSSPVVEGIDPNPSQEQVAKWAVMQADKLIEELKKK